MHRFSEVIRILTVCHAEWILFEATEVSRFGLIGRARNPIACSFGLTLRCYFHGLPLIDDVANCPEGSLSFDVFQLWGGRIAVASRNWRVPEPYDCAPRPAIDRGHQCDLMPSLNHVIRVNTYSISPQKSRPAGRPDVPDGLLQVCGYPKFVTLALHHDVPHVLGTPVEYGPAPHVTKRIVIQM